MTYRIGEPFVFEYFNNKYKAWGATATVIKTYLNHGNRNLKEAIADPSKYYYCHNVLDMLSKNINEAIVGGLRNGSVELYIDTPKDTEANATDKMA